eukprot:scaffold159663_cov15-Prasinocladus_malaysianus.AAC.1
MMPAMHKTMMTIVSNCKLTIDMGLGRSIDLAETTARLSRLDAWPWERMQTGCMVRASLFLEGLRPISLFIIMSEHTGGFKLHDRT